MDNAKKTRMTTETYKVGYVTTISTDHGQLVVEIVEDGSIIREPGTYRPMAKFNTRDKYEVTKLTRRCSSFLNMKRNLEMLGVSLSPDTMDLLAAQYNTNGGKLRFESVSKQQKEAFDKALLKKAKEGGRPVLEHKKIPPVLAKRKEKVR